MEQYLQIKYHIWTVKSEHYQDIIKKWREKAEEILLWLNWDLGGIDMGCVCAKVTDEYHGWECKITGGACSFLTPNQDACADMYGEVEKWQEANWKKI